jgi:hypothetical protein
MLTLRLLCVYISIISAAYKHSTRDRSSNTNQTPVPYTDQSDASSLHSPIGHKILSQTDQTLVPDTEHTHRSQFLAQTNQMPVLGTHLIRS